MPSSDPNADELTDRSQDHVIDAGMIDDFLNDGGRQLTRIAILSNVLVVFLLCLALASSFSGFLRYQREFLILDIAACLLLLALSFRTEAVRSRVRGLIRKVAVSLRESKRRDDDRRQQEQLYRLMIQNVKDYAIFLLDPSGYVATWNLGAERIKGYMADEIIGQHFSRFYPPEDLANGKPEMELRVAAEEGRFEDEGWRLRKDGGKLWANVIITAMKDDNGALLGFSKITRDISKHKQSEEELRSSEEHFRSMIEGAKDYAILFLDPSGLVSSWNEGAERIKGYTAGEIIGQHFSRFYTPEDIASGKPGVELKEAIREGHFEDEGWRVRKDGSRFWANIVVTALRKDDGSLRGFCKITRDITERKRAESEIVRLNEGLEKQNAELEAFTYSVAHDLRAPLRHIFGFSKILKEDYGPKMEDEAREYLDDILQDTIRMGNLIDDLLGLAQIARRDLRIEVTGLRSVVDEALRDLNDETKDRQIDWRIGDLPYVACDPGLVKLIFVNLLSNALKYSRPRNPSVIEVGAQEEGMERILYVRDNGVGFNMKYADKLFGVFQRLHRSEDFEGTGVGLATVQRIINKHGGRIWVEAEIDSGAAFYFTLGTQKTEGDIDLPAFSAGKGA